MATFSFRSGTFPHHRTPVRIAMATAGFLLVASVACALLLSWLAEGEAQRKRGTELLSLARQTALRLDDDMERRVSQLTNLVGSGALGDLGQPQHLRSVVDRVKESWKGYAWIGVADAAGRVLSASGGLLEGVNVSARPWFQHGRVGVFAGDVHEAALLASRLRGPEGEPLRFVDIALPLLDRQGRVTAVLGAHIYWDWARQVGQSVLGPHQEAFGPELLVISADKQVLLGPRSLQGTVLEVPLAATPVSAALTGDGHHSAGSVQKWPDGQLYLSTTVEVPGGGSFRSLGWAVVARQSLAHSGQFAHHVFLSVLAVGGSLAVVSGVITWLLVRRALSQVPVVFRAAAAGGAFDPFNRMQVGGSRPSHRGIFRQS